MSNVIGDGRTERGKLASGIPSTQLIKDPEAKRVADAMTQVLDYLLRKIKVLSTPTASSNANMTRKNSGLTDAELQAAIAAAMKGMTGKTGGSGRPGLPGETGPAGADGSAALPVGTDGQILRNVGGTWTAVSPLLRKVVHTVTYDEATKTMVLGWTNMYVIAMGASGGETVFTAEECP
jgi:hypothetical protein